MDIAEMIYNEYTKDTFKKNTKEEFLTKEKKFIDKLSVADARDYYLIIEDLNNCNSREQLDLIRFVINFYKQLFSGSPQK